MRYAKLKKEWLLRGWTDETWTLLNWKNGDCRTLSEPLFSTACACDGQTDFDNIAGFLQKNVLLDKLITAGMVEECRCGEGVEPYQQFRRADNPYIHHIQWSITGRCNLKCRHCYMESPDNRYGELPLRDILRIIDQLAAANVHRVALTGGEPFVREDLPEIMEALAQQQIAVAQIYSNGVLISDNVLQGIKKYGFLPNVQISLDGRGTHDAMRGVDGSEQATIKVIRLLRKHGFPVTISTSIDRTNIESLSATYELLKELNIQYWRVAPPLGIGNWRQSATGLAWEEILTVCAQVMARWLTDNRPFLLQVPGFQSPIGKEAENQENYSPESYDCTTCRLSCSLMPDGKIIPCPGYTDTDLYEQMPNLLETPFSSIWSDSMLRTIVDIKKGEVLKHNRQCVDCDEFGRCGGGCRATALLATGDLLAAAPQSCEMYKNKYQQRFDKLAGVNVAESDEAASCK